MPINEEKTAVESRLAEIENEMSEAHRDHAFDYWWKIEGGDIFGDRRKLARAAFDRAILIYGKETRIMIERPPVCGLYGLFAIGVVIGFIITTITGIIIL